MNFQELLDSTFCLHLTLTLAHFLWQGLVIAVVAVLAARCLRRSPAQSRYLIHAAALLLMVACLPVTFAVVRGMASGPAPSPKPDVIESPGGLVTPPADLVAPPADLVDTSADPIVPPANMIERPPASRSTKDESPAPEAEPAAAAQADGFEWQKLTPYAAGAYLVGVLVMLTRLWLALQGGRRLRQHSQPVDDPGLLQIIRQQAQLLGLRFVPLVAYCERVTVPVVLGVLRPMILLPLSLGTGLTPDQLRAILTHELTHLRRYDHLVNLLQRFVEAVLFYHPAAWYVSWRINVERENCCDDLVVATGEQRCVYAESLVRVAELSLSARTSDRPRAALGASDGSSSRLGQRILRLIDGHPHEKFRLWRTWPVACVLILTIAIGSFVFLSCSGDATQSAGEPGLVAGKPRLADQKLLTDDSDQRVAERLPGTVRLSPDARYMVYISRQAQKIPGDNKDGPPYEFVDRIAVRNVESGKDKLLPMPAFPAEFLTAMMPLCTFDPSGTKIVVPTGLDDNGDGFHSMKKEKMQAMVYDVVTGEATRLGPTGDEVVPVFNRTGKSLIVSTLDGGKKPGKSYLVPIGRGKYKQLAVSGFSLTPCPVADLLPLVLEDSKLVLYDPRADEQTAELPARIPDNLLLNSFFPQWTADGRYLYYTDATEEEDDGRTQTQTATRIWDRITGKEVGELKRAFVLGAGPGKTTMLMINDDGSSHESVFLHDAASGKS